MLQQAHKGSLRMMQGAVGATPAAARVLHYTVLAAGPSHPQVLGVVSHAFFCFLELPSMGFSTLNSTD
jgi:hypothetical protein